MGSLTSEDNHFLNNNCGKNKGTAFARRTMNLIFAVERRKRHLSFFGPMIAIWFVLVVPIWCHYVTYNLDAFGRDALKTMAIKIESLEGNFFDKDFLLNTNRSLVSYMRAWDQEFYEYHIGQGLKNSSLMWFGTIGLLGAILGSRMLKFYGIHNQSPESEEAKA
ncbi:hypothetical protein C4553_02400 [Candidatus Parcubacteria bacterium]|nr:MAG: hypothetical protein C4553_02400 [Candidatus Parcubacteria bacterium]